VEISLIRLIEDGLTAFGIAAPQGTLQQLDEYVHQLHRWNRQVNLTGLKVPSSVVRNLLYDAFFLSPRLASLDTLLDLGSGAGILAVPLALLNRALTVVSLDKTLKKIQFQRHAKRALGIENLVLVHGRVEDVAPLNAAGLVAKAFGATEVILRLGALHLRPGGTAFILKGEQEQPLMCDGYVLQEDLRYVLPPDGPARRLFVYRRV
jgi:16S rRNA (guanine527-N7)-methyltransferase